MLLFDLSGVVINACINLHHQDKEEVDLNMVRHVALSQILYYKKRFAKYGKPVIAVDMAPYWRKIVFQYYKGKRKDERTKSGFDWDAFKKHFDVIKADLEEYLPYAYINVKNCEADDVMMVLTQYAYARRDPVMLVCSDKDMVQLQVKFGTDFVQQYSPSVKKLITPKSTKYDLLTHIIKGDAGDGIPNIFSDDDVFMCEDKRQKSVYQKVIDEYHTFDDPMESIEDEVIRKRFKRNRLLIDSDYVPDRIRDAIIEKYKSETGTNKPNKIFAYAKQNRMRSLMDRMKEF